MTQDDERETDEQPPNDPTPTPDGDPSPTDPSDAETPAESSPTDESSTPDPTTTGVESGESAPAEQGASEPAEQEASEPAERGPDEVYCSSCGEVIKQEAEICPHCGVRQQSSSTNIGGEPGNLDPALAGVASFLLPGLGQAYNGQVPRGIAVFLAVMMADFIIITISFILTFLVIGIFGFLLVPVVHVLAAADAYSQAGKINRGEVSVA